MIQKHLKPDMKWRPLGYILGSAGFPRLCRLFEILIAQVVVITCRDLLRQLNHCLNDQIEAAGS